MPHILKIPAHFIHEIIGLYILSFMKEVKKEFDKSSISIPFPQRDVHIFNAS